MALFDILKDTVFRRGKDTPILRRGMEKVADVLAEQQRERASSRWPLASDPEGQDIFSKMIVDTEWALHHLYLAKDEFNAQRYDGADASGWRIGRGTHISVFDIDTKSRAGSDGREHNDLWLEALHEPVFGWLAFAPYPDLWLEDVETHYRRTPVPDDVPELQRRYSTGRYRVSGEWCAVAHLDPLVLRVRYNTHHATRDRLEYAFSTILQRLDLDAFVAWRDRVRTLREPGEQPEAAEAPAPALDWSPDTLWLLPAPDAIKSGLDQAISDREALTLPEGPLAEAFGGPIEETHTFALPDAEGVRYVSTAGRVLDVMRLTDPGLAEAVRRNAVRDVTVEMHPEPQGQSQFANLNPDSDGAARAAFLRDDAVFIARVRGVKREDTQRLMALVLDRYR